VPPLPSACDDGTPMGACSSNLPFYCTTSRHYVANCPVCGCPGDYTCFNSTICVQSNVQPECGGGCPEGYTCVNHVDCVLDQPTGD